MNPVWQTHLPTHTVTTALIMPIFYEKIELQLRPSLSSFLENFTGERTSSEERKTPDNKWQPQVQVKHEKEKLQDITGEKRRLRNDREKSEETL